MTDVTIRSAHDEDLDAVMDLYAEFHAFHVAGVPDRLRPMPPQSAHEREELRDLLQSFLHESQAALLVAEVDHHLVGLAEVHLRRDEELPRAPARTYGYLQSLMVTAAQRRTGIGRELMAAAEAWAKSCGASELQLEMWEFAAGPLPFYEKQGYTTLRRKLVRRLA